MNIQTSEERVRQHALYNWQNKYNNIKSELAASYIRDLVAQEVGERNIENISLIETLKELFTTFFPGKNFLGPHPQIDGSISFPVRLNSGAIHDIDDLSSGEKEVLYGYLRIRNTAPQNSILLIDEPELHLNPRLIHGLPQFYHKHIGQALGNQLWLVTHSDALLRQSVGQSGFSVFHMQSADISEPKENQVYEINAENEIESAIIDLVGDLASYRPGAKTVIFEGGGNDDFDVRMTGTLFPEFQAEVNMISIGSKRRVKELHSLLQQASKEGKLQGKFYSIVDRDADLESTGENSFSWDRYHIENYLLEPTYIYSVLVDINAITGDTNTEEKILFALKECAKDTLNDLVRHELEQMADKKIIGLIKTSTDRSKPDISVELHNALDNSVKRVIEIIESDFNPAKLTRNETKIRVKLNANLNSEDWLKTFRGREILNLFVGKYVKIVKYEVFRDLIISRMRDKVFRPDGMKKVIEQILY